MPVAYNRTILSKNRINSPIQLKVCLTPLLKLVLVGPHLPHVWRSDKIYYENLPEIRVELILTQFIREFAGKDFLNLPEMHGVRELLDEAVRGLQVLGKTREVVSEKLRRLMAANAYWALLMSCTTWPKRKNIENCPAWDSSTVINQRGQVGLIKCRISS